MDHQGDIEDDDVEPPNDSEHKHSDEDDESDNDSEANLNKVTDDDVSSVPPPKELGAEHDEHEELGASSTIDEGEESVANDDDSDVKDVAEASSEDVDSDEESSDEDSDR